MTITGASDPEGGSVTTTVTGESTLRVAVLHDQDHAPVDSAPPSFDSTLP